MQLEEMRRLEHKRKYSRIWFPLDPLHKLSSWGGSDTEEPETQAGQDEDPGESVCFPLYFGTSFMVPERFDTWPFTRT